MAIFNTNQNRQFYVLKTKKSDVKSLTEVGDYFVKDLEDGTFVLYHYGEGGLTRSDLIDAEKVTYARLTKADSMKRYQKIKKVKFSEEHGDAPIQGQDYILRVEIHNYLAPGDANVYVKSNAVRATKAMVANAEDFWNAMAESLEKNFYRDIKASGVKLLEFEPSSDGIEVKEVTNQPYRVGVVSQDVVNFELVPTTVTLDGEDVIWGEVESSVSETEYTGNGAQIADLEYFCMAERGDMFRNMGWPNNIDVKYMVDPKKEYDVLDIHYYYSGDGVQVHKSEKDLTVVAETGNIDKTAFTLIQDKITETPVE